MTKFYNSKLKAFARNIRKTEIRFTNGRKHLPGFFPFPAMFSKGMFQWVLFEVRIVCERVHYIYFLASAEMCTEIQLLILSTPSMFMED